MKTSQQNSADASSSGSSSKNSTKSAPKKSSGSGNSSKIKLKKSSSSNSSHSSQKSQLVVNDHATTNGTDAGSNSNHTEKANLKSYSGFDKNSMKYIWEQQPNSENDVMVSAVFPHLAEDVTYKIWDLANSLKTFTRHSGGRLTCDIVNEVLKDSNAGPIIGAGNHESTSWERICYDDTYYFHSDSVINLRDEYQKDIQVEETGPTVIRSHWICDIKASKDLVLLCNHVTNAIFLGDEDCFSFALDITLNNKYIASAIRLLLKKVIELLVIDYKEDTLLRAIPFLRALALNNNTRDAAIDEQLYHLAHLFVCLLLGPIDFNKTERVRIQTREENRRMEKEIIHIKQELQSFRSTSKPTRAVEDLKDDLDAICQLMQQDGFQEKLFDPSDFKSPIKIKEDPNLSQILPDFNESDLQNTEQFSFDQTDDEQRDNFETNKQEKPSLFSPLLTRMCETSSVDELCQTIGVLSAMFGYFETEISFLISKRMEYFFEDDAISFVPKDLEWVRRLVLAIVCIGDLAAREIIPYLNKIVNHPIPDYLTVYFNALGQFTRGASDIYLYEAIEHVTGDGVQPYLVYAARKSLKVKKCVRQDIYTVKPKLILTQINMPQGKQSSHDLESVFVNYKRVKKKEMFFKFNTNGIEDRKTKFMNGTSSNSMDFSDSVDINSSLVVCKRRNMKTLTNRKKINSHCSIAYFNL